MALLSDKAWAGVWSAVLQWSRIGLNAVVFVVLSRWLTLAEIGAVAAAQAPVLMLQSTLASAMPDAVVQERDPSKMSSLFWLSAIMGAACTVILLLVGPLLAAQISHPDSLAYFQTLAFCPAIWSVSWVADGMLRKSLQMRLLAIRTTIATLAAGVIAIAIAMAGHGGWAMVGFFLVNAITSTVVTLIAQRWIPEFSIDWNYLADNAARLLSLIGRYFLSSITNPVLQFLVTAQLGLQVGGAFQLALRLYGLIGALVVAPLRYLALPLFSRIQDDRSTMGSGLVRAIAVGSCLTSPAFFGMIAVAPDLLPVLLGKANGMPSVDLFRILSAYGPFQVPVGLVNQALTAAGMAVAVIRRSIIIYILVMIPCVLSAFHSVVAVCLSYAIVGAATGISFSLRLGKEHLHVDPMEQFLAFARPLLAAALMLGALELLQAEMSSLLPIVRVIISIVVGAPLYLGLLFLLARPQVAILWSVLRGRRGGKGKGGAGGL